SDTQPRDAHPRRPPALSLAQLHAGAAGGAGGAAALAQPRAGVAALASFRLAALHSRAGAPRLDAWAGSRRDLGAEREADRRLAEHGRAVRPDAQSAL